MDRSEAVPAALAAALTRDVADEIAAVYGDQVVFPKRIVIDDLGGQRSFPGWPGPVLLLSHENQGVVSWGAPLGDPSPPVVVGGGLDEPELDRAGTVVYAPSVTAFINARRWDRSCVDGKSLVQAQAAVLDAGTLAALRARFREVPATRGWPGREQYRFEGRGTRLMLWSGPRQCDWWLSGTDLDTLAEGVAGILALSNLREALWSNDPAGDALLRNAGAGR